MCFDISVAKTMSITILRTWYRVVRSASERSNLHESVCDRKCPNKGVIETRGGREGGRGRERERERERGKRERERERELSLV